ncbi:NAD(P)H-hydrate dehydratase [Luteolibacter ambystomatis]|uniref:Bifunctional NAD(P)H-hydrate repair enzyme n=1 Tax=Luteolibacter ambystomatis TaxID=2824561 RepID=A0A975G7Q3_9BACT|nr:NAD(P)H-hydrate dehydratase [Luteolibacter ambystomatis]QUE50348.1 NAD(P)H-hydrate dehydratase [Luteolibacter ambystomatis]
MGAVTADEMRALEEAAFQKGATAASLMTKAGRRLGLAIARMFPRPGTAVAYLGKGHNAGDALVALGVLRAAGWQVVARASRPLEECADLTRAMFEALGGVTVLEASPDVVEMPRPLVLLDGLLGIGANGGPRGTLAALSREMNGLRRTAGARVVAVDLPSGVDADTGVVHPDAVIADVTLTIGVPKRGLLQAAAVHAVGALGLVPVEELRVPEVGDLALISPWTLAAGREPRPFDFHKGRAGRVALLAGSVPYSGAAVLAATGALRGGAGLVTLHVPVEAHALIAAKCPPEVMVRPVSDPRDLLGSRFDSLVVGPGLGEADGDTLRELLEGCSVPAVIDADALNALAKCGGVAGLPSHHVLTPHPGEFARLAPDLTGQPREAAARLFADRSSPVLLLKGARTLVTAKGKPLWCNSTGTPGMATGGQGDVLSGVIGALLAGGMESLDAAALGAWLCGRASERAIAAGASEESLSAGDAAAHLGGAFRDWREGTR